MYLVLFSIVKLSLVFFGFWNCLWIGMALFQTNGALLGFHNRQPFARCPNSCASYTIGECPLMVLFEFTAAKFSPFIFLFLIKKAFFFGYLEYSFFLVLCYWINLDLIGFGRIIFCRLWNIILKACTIFIFFEVTCRNYYLVVRWNLNNHKLNNFWKKCSCFWRSSRNLLMVIDNFFLCEGF